MENISAFRHTSVNPHAIGPPRTQCRPLLTAQAPGPPRSEPACPHGAWGMVRALTGCSIDPIPEGPARLSWLPATLPVIIRPHFSSRRFRYSPPVGGLTLFTPRSNSRPIMRFCGTVYLDSKTKNMRMFLAHALPKSPGGGAQDHQGRDHGPCAPLATSLPLNNEHYGVELWWSWVISYLQSKWGQIWKKYVNFRENDSPLLIPVWRENRCN